MKPYHKSIETNQLTIWIDNTHCLASHHFLVDDFNEEDIDFMVVCKHCNSVYDLRKVEVTHRFKDCTNFTTPCCNYEHADDRKEYIHFGEYTHYTKLKDYLKDE